MEFVIIMILFDVKDCRLLYGSRKYTHDSQDFCKCSSVDVFGTKARMDTYRIWSSLDRVESLMFQNLLEPASNNTTR